MDGNFPSRTANGEPSHGVADNIPWGHQALDSTNDTSFDSANVTLEGSYEERWDENFPSSCPESLLHKGPVSRMQGILPEVAPSSSSSSLSSTYKHNATVAFSQDCQDVPFGPTLEAIKFSSFPTYQQPSRGNFRYVPENYTERRESMTSNGYNSVNDHLAVAQKQVLKENSPYKWTSVIKGTLEMCNRMELEQDLQHGSQISYDPPTDSRVAELKKNHFVCVDNEISVQERREMSKAQELTFNVLSDNSKLNQDFQQKTVIQYIGPLIDGSSLNDKVLDETSCRTHKRSLSAGFYDATEVCSLAENVTTDMMEVSCFTTRPCLSVESNPVIPNNHKEFTNFSGHMPCASLIASYSTGNEKDLSVLGQTLQQSSHRTSKENAQSDKKASALKCMDGQTKSYTDNNATLYRHLSIPGHHLKFDTISAEVGSVHSSPSDSKQDDCVCNLKKGNPSTPTLIPVENFQMPVEDSRTCIESEELNLSRKMEESTNISNATCTPIKPDVLTIAAQRSYKVVGKKGTRGACMLDDTSACIQSQSSCELSSSDRINTDSSDKETDNGQTIAQNIMNAGSVRDDILNSQEQLQSLTVSSEIKVTSLVNICKERRSEVNFWSPQAHTGSLEKETGQVEPYKDHSSHCTEHERKIDPDCKSPRVNLSSMSTHVIVKKRVGCGFKKRTLLKMDSAFSTVQKSSESRDLKRGRTKAKNIQSLLRNRRKSCCTASTIRKEKKLLPNSCTETKKDGCCRKSQKVKHPGLVLDCGQKRCVKSSKISRQHIVQVFQPSSGLQSSQFQTGSSNTNKLLGCFEDTLKTEKHHMPQSSAKDHHSNTANALLKTPSMSQNESADVTESRKETSLNNRKNDKSHSTELNDDAAFELSLRSTINSTGFQSCITNALYQKVKDERSRNPLLDESVKTSDKHLGELSEKDVGIKHSLCGSNPISLKHSPVQKVDGFTQYYDEDCMTMLNKDTLTVANASRSTRIAKKYINCKYCHRSFRHISAYTIHQRIHTGEKPYRCELCGKNFAQLSKLKSHRNVHVQSASFPCPCCRKKFSGKRDLIAHFMIHIKDYRQDNEPDQQDIKLSTRLRESTHSQSLICNIYNNRIPNRFMQNIHKHNRDKFMSCNTCGKEFWKPSQLVVHEKTHWPVKPYACSICAKGFNRIKALKRHSEKHTGEMPFSCSYCSRAFCDLPALRVHQISKSCKRKQRDGENGDIEGFLVAHGVDGQVNAPVFFKRQTCKQLYQKWCQYILHLQTQTNSPPCLCSVCGQSYEKHTDVNFHCRVCCQTTGEEVACGSSPAKLLHSEPRKCTCLKDSSPIDLYSIEDSKSQSQSSSHQFHNNSQTLCNLQIVRLVPDTSQVVKGSDLPENVHLSNDDRLPSPSPSGIACASVNETRECVQVSPDLWRFKCPRCGQRYKQYRTLCFHMQTHAPTFRYVCGHCGRSFERWNRLWLHQRIHRQKGRCYTCSQCSLQFHFFSSYKIHLLTHAEERPYACPLCPQTFAHEEGLHVHQCNFHQPLRKFQCNVCSRGFSNLTNLVKHNLLHNGAIPHQCLLCSLSFANKKSLQEHLSTHDNSVNLLPSIPSEPLTFPHKCNRCKASFSTGDLLYTHQICHTRDLKSQVLSTQSSESTSGILGGTRSSTSRSLLSTLDLDVIPKESLYKYPHPDKLYVPPHLSTMSKSTPIINLGTGDEDLPQQPSTGPSGSSQEHSKRVMASEGQESVQSPNTEEIPVLHTDTVNDNLKDKASHDNLTQTIEFFETSVFLEGTSTTVNVSESETQEEIFQCADCSEKLGSLTGLYEHYFLHALGNTRFYDNRQRF